MKAPLTKYCPTPGIAKIFDAGSTDSGRLYFVMELVDGESITKHCDRERLTLDERLDQEFGANGFYGHRSTVAAPLTIC